MTHPEQALGRLLKLLEREEAGGADAESQQRLAELLCDEPELIEAYVAHRMLNAQLEWEYSEPLALPESSKLERQSHAEDQSLRQDRRYSSSPSTLGDKVFHLLSRALPEAIHPERHRAAFLVAASLLTAVFCGSLVLMIWSQDRRNRNDNQGATGFIARITHIEQAIWAEGQTGVHLGSRLLPGQRLELEKGLVHLQFLSGARVVIEGPAKVRVDTSETMTLKGGRLLAQVSKRAQGFMVETPNVDVVDLGTKFGVHVREKETELQVFKGKVQARHHDRAGGQDRTLLAGEAIVFGNSPQLGFFVKEKKMNRAIYLALATVMTAAAPEGVHAVPITLGLEAHFDAQALGLTNGASVASWTDETGNGNNATQAIGNQQPIYVTGAINGNAVVRFRTNATVADGGSDTLSTNSFVTNPYSVFAVVRMPGTVNARTISYGPTNEANWTLGHIANSQNLMYAGGFLGTSEAVDTLTRLWTGTGSGALTSFYKDGAFQDSSASFLDAPGSLSFASNREVAEFSDVDIAEVIVYDRVLSDEERDLVGGYIQQKYGITIANATFPPSVPEPASGALLGLGGMMVIGFARRRRRSRGKVG